LFKGFAENLGESRCWKPRMHLMMKKTILAISFSFLFSLVFLNETLACQGTVYACNDVQEIKDEYDANCGCNGDGITIIEVCGDPYIGEYGGPCV